VTEGSNIDQQVSCIAITIAKPGFEDRIHKALADLIEPVRQEKGMIQYDMFQDPAEPRRYVFIERWDNMADFEAHCVAPHINEYLRVTDGWIEHSEFHALKKVL
jgi:quinol monooxygenase YgiN